MQHSKIFGVLSLGILGFFASCTKTGSTGPAGPVGPAGPSYTGAISGHVSLYDQYGTKVLTGINSVQVSLDGNAAIAPDATGYYMIGGVSTGSHYMTASNSGYGSTRADNFQFLSDTLNKDIKMAAIPDFSPATIAATVVATGDSVALTFPVDTRARNYILFVNNNSTVGGMPSNYLLAYSRAIAANSTRPVTFVIPTQDLRDAGIASGATVYLAAYGYVTNDVSAYEDYQTGKTVYTAISAASMTTTITAP